MSHGSRGGPSQPRQAMDTTGRTRTSMTPREKKRKQLDNAVNNAITTAKIVKDAGKTIPLLAPLKASMGIVINLLEIVRDARKCEQDWETLSNHFTNRIGLLRDHLANKPTNVELQELIIEYKEALEQVVRRTEPLARKHKIWFQFVASSKNDEDKIKDSIREMDEAFNTFTTKLHLTLQQGFSYIQSGQESIHEEVVAHRADHAKSHARILEVQEMQKNVNQTMNYIHTEQRETRSQLTEAEETILLSTLSVASLANGDKHEICLKGTRIPILEEARSWFKSEIGPQIFWLTDVAGSGKSTVANHLAREWKMQNQLAGRFFFSRAAEQTRTTMYFFSTLAQQGLSQLGPKVRSVVSDGIRYLSNPVAAPLEDQCRLLFVEPMAALPLPIVLVLDGLDECEPSALTRLFRVLLPQLGNLPHLRLLLTSRPDNYIRESLQNIQVYRASLRRNVESNRMDIWKFIVEKLESISIPQAKIDQLVDRSDGLFIWASTVCKLLLIYRGDRYQFLEEVLVRGPKQMDTLYQVALQQALPDRSVCENLKAYKQVLSVIVVAFEPLSPNTINNLLQIQNAFEIVGDLQSVLDCHHPEDPVRFLHPTFREFLLQSPEHNPYCIDEKMSHLSLAHACLGLMGDNLHWDICDLFRRPIENDEDGEAHQTRFIQCTTHSLRYSCHFWTGHLTSCDAASILHYKDIPTRLEQFFQKNLLDWVYIISMTKTVKDPWVLLRRLIAARLSERLTSWANDTSRFLKAYSRGCQSRPLDVYYHFAFTPKSTIFQKVYSKSQSFPHPIVTMGLEDDWPPYTYIKTHCIFIQCLSPCGTWSATGGSENSYPVYGVWDIELADGETNVHPCGTNDCSVVNISWLYDHTHQLRLQTFCSCNMLFLWNLSTLPHTLLKGMKLHSNKEYRMWSDDGSKAIVYQRQDKDPLVYRLWKRESPQSYFQLRYKDRDPNSPSWWSFSPSTGDKLEYHTSNRLEMWECSGVKRLFRKVFDETVVHAQFSPNAEIIITSIRDMSIHCMSSHNGATIWNIPVSHVYGYRSMNFTSSGQKIICQDINHGKGIAIDIMNGSLLASTSIKEPLSWRDNDELFSLKAKRSSKESLGYLFIHPGEEQTALLVREKNHDTRYTISLWNPFSDKDMQQLEEVACGDHTSAMCTLFDMSWQHRVLVGANWGGCTVVFHSIQPHRSIAKAPLCPVETIFISPTGEYLVTFSKHSSIQIWGCKLGNKIMNYNLGLGSLSQSMATMNFDEHEPSFFFHWDPQSLTVIDIKRCVGKSFNTNYGTTSFPPHISISSARILVIDNDGMIYSQPWEASRKLICQLSSPPSMSRQITISPTKNEVALVQCGLLVIEEMSKNGYKLHWPGAFAGAMFAPDGSHITVLENYNGLMTIISHLKLPDFTVIRSWICHLGTGVRLAPDYSRHMMRVFSTSQPMIERYYTLDSWNGNVVSIYGLYQDKTGCIHYGRCQLKYPLKEYWDYPVWKLSKDVAAHLDHDKQVVVADMSLWTDHIRSKSGFIEDGHLWKYPWLDWCKTFARCHLNLDTQLTMDALNQPRVNVQIGSGDILETVIKCLCTLEHLAEFERKTRELKTWGSLQEALCKLEGEKVNSIRSDAPLMRVIEALWRDENLTVLQELRCGFDKALRHRIKEEFERRSKKGFRDDWSNLHPSKFIQSTGREDLPIDRTLELLATFACIYQLRVENCEHRSDWESIYQEIEKGGRMRGLKDQDVEQEVNWLNWMKNNTASGLSEDDSRTR